jgi:hypothetical protein
MVSRFIAAFKAFRDPNLMYGYLSGAQVLRHASLVAARSEASDQNVLRLRQQLSAIETSLRRGDAPEAILNQWFAPGTVRSHTYGKF